MQNPSTPPSVAVANLAYIAHFPHLVLGIQEAGMLHTAFVGSYHKPGINQQLAKAFPPLARRVHPAIDASKVQTLLWVEMLRILTTRFPYLSYKQFELNRLILHRQFGNSVGRRLKSSSVDIVVSANPSALELFQHAKKQGRMTILSQRTPHFADVEKQQLAAESSMLYHDGWNHKYLDSPQRNRDELALADFVLCPSRTVIDSLTSNGVAAEKCLYLPYGIETDRFAGMERVKKDDKFRIISVGRLTHLKGTDLLVQAFRELNLPNAELLLIGRDAGDLDIQDDPALGIIKVGRILPEQLNSYYLDANIFVFPTRAEAAGRALYEAMLAGLPVITSPEAGEFVKNGHNGYVVDPRNVENLKEKIRYLYDNREIAEKYGLRSKEVALTLSWDAYRRRLGEHVISAWQQHKTEHIQ